MPYIPKNRIQTNLYTAGEEFYVPGVISNYVGYYYKLFNGKSYTGKTPNDKPNYFLVPIEEYNVDAVNTPSKIEILNSYETLIYSELIDPPSSTTVYSPQLFYTQPTEDDYKLGEFQRYFCKKRNEFIYLEISQSEYDKLSQSDSTIDFKNWNPFQIPWTLTGDKNEVYYINRNIVLLEEKNNKFYGFGKYLREEYLRYYQS